MTWKCGAAGFKQPVIPPRKKGYTIPTTRKAEKVRNQTALLLRSYRKQRKQVNEIQKTIDLLNLPHP